MNTTYFLITAIANMPDASHSSFWWLSLLALVMVVCGGYIMHRRILSDLLHKNADLERQVLERTELLSYAKVTAQKAREDVAMANQNKSSLITKISHDIRTPMNTIMGMAALLSETTLNQEQQEFTSTIMYSGESLLSTINGILMNDILEYSKVESGRELEFKEFDLRSHIEEVYDIFSSKAVQTKTELIYFIKPDVPVQVIGDALRLRQILMNLVENSLRFTSGGEILIVVNLLEQLEDNHIKLEFEVRDTGAGITAERLKTLATDLKPETAESSHMVIGMALTICKKLVRLMGGTITVESQEKAGTVFKFTIVTTAAKQNPRLKTLQEMANLAGKKILIAHNNVTLGNLIKQQFERWKLVAFFANTGDETLAIIAKEGCFDIALIDFEMPKTDGITLSKAVKQLCPELPIILINKNGNEDYKNHPAIFSAIMDKPLKHRIFTEHILNLLRQKSKSTSTNEQASKQKLSVEFAKQYPLEILIAEDDKMNQKLVTKILNKLGYEPNIAENGKEVLELVSQGHYDMILMDVQMPEMDGLEATRMIRVCLSNQPVIIAMTANTLQGDREICLKAGMDDYIGKPVRLDALVNLIENWALQGQQKQ